MFTLGRNECTFVINNDDYSTSSTTVDLNMNCKKAKSMRFSNQAKDFPDRETFETGYVGWPLLGDVGTNTVYAEFTDGSETVQTSDDIEY